ncbi:MAG: hypothetical protein ACPL88_08070, partial [Bryobacteraceae bacterium]
MRHNLTVTYVYELPFGPGKRFLSGLSGPARWLVSSWQINGITSLRSGYPIRIIIPGDIANKGVSGGRRLNLVGRWKLPASQRTSERWFDTSAFAMPAPHTFGNLGRNAVGGPGVANWDFGLYKNFALAEKFGLQFRAEIFNLFNHTKPRFTRRHPQYGAIRQDFGHQHRRPRRAVGPE